MSLTCEEAAPDFPEYDFIRELCGGGFKIACLVRDGERRSPSAKRSEDDSPPLSSRRGSQDQVLSWTHSTICAS